MYTLKIQRILNQIDQIQHNAEKVKLVLQAIQIADDNQDIEWGYDLRMELINYEIDLAFSPESLPAFAWILQTYDDNPTLFNEDDFLWQYKWMMSELYDNPAVSREQIAGALADFETRLLRNGYGKRAVYNEELSDALVQKDLAAIETALQQVNAVQRDDMSDCEACEMDAEVSATLLRDGYDKAYSKALPLLEKQFTCAHVPLRTAVNLAYEGQKSGREDQAAKLAVQAEQEIYNKERDTSILLSAIKLSTYFSLTDTDKAHHWYQRFIPWADGPEDRTMFQLSCLVVEGMQKFAGSTVFHLDLSETHSLYQHKSDYTADEIADHYRALATTLAAQFDARNGNTNFTRQQANLSA